LRIACLQPSTTLIFEALGRLGDVCAYTKYCVEAIPSLAGGPVMHDSWQASEEELIALHADLIVASVPYRMEPLTKILKRGIPVLALAPKTLADVVADVRLLASIVHADPSVVIETFEGAFAEVRSRVAGLDKPLVYCEEWGKPLMISQGWVKEIVEAAGGRFLGEPGKVTTAEEVADAEPDVMVFAWCGARDRVPLAKVVAGRGWEGLKAVRERRVYCVDDSLLNTPAPTLVGGLWAVAGCVHPEVFSPLDRVIRLEA
jgi:iron complex transport system substrate-binding protein